MDFIVTDPDPLLDAFLDKFTSRRSRPSQAEGFRAYVLGQVSEAHRKNVEALSDKTIGEPYQRLHHFLTDALSLLMPKDFRPVGLAMADGTKREVHVARLLLKIKRLSGKRRVVAVTTRPNDPKADEDLRFLTTNIVPLRDATVADLDARRNWVEVFYREAKDDLGAGQYQVRDLGSIVRHWMLVFVAYTLLVLLKRRGQLGRWCKKNSTPSARPSGPCGTTCVRSSSSTGCPTTENLSKNTYC